MALRRTLTAARSRSFVIDYGWAGSPEAVAKAQACASFGDNTNPTVVLQRTADDSWQLLADGLGSGRKDRAQTPIRNTYFWEGLTEKEARCLAARFLSQWDECAQRLAGLIVEKRDDAQRGWECDWNAAAVLDQMLADAQKDVTLPAVGTLPSRLQRPHDGVGSAQWQELAGELREYSLPSYEAATLVVSSFPTSQATEKAKEIAFRLYLEGVKPCDLDKKKELPQKPSQPPISREPSTTPSGSSETSSAAEPIISKGALLIACAIVAILVTLIFGRDSNKKKREIERLGFVEVEPKALRLNIFFDKVSAEDLKQVLHVQTPETWSTKLLGWNPDTRSFSLELTPIESKRTGTFSIAFPFPVEKRKLEVNLLPPWTAESEWGGEELILRVRSPDSDPK